MKERTTDPGMIEQRLLEMAYETDSKITPTALAYFAHCSIEDAQSVLDNLVARDRISLDVEDDGTLLYQVPNRHKLTPREEPMALHVIKPPSMPLAIRDGRPASPALAALLGLFVPGAGHLYTGRTFAAILWFALVGLGYFLFLPGLMLHVISIGAAAGSAHRLNSTLYQHRLVDPDLAPRATR